MVLLRFSGYDGTLLPSKETETRSSWAKVLRDRWIQPKGVAGLARDTKTATVCPWTGKVEVT